MWYQSSRPTLGQAVSEFIVHVIFFVKIISSYSQNLFLLFKIGIGKSKISLICAESIFHIAVALLPQHMKSGDNPSAITFQSTYIPCLWLICLHS